MLRPSDLVRLNADGNFRIAPPYVAAPALTAKADVPKGRVIRFTMNSAESKSFPTAPDTALKSPSRMQWVCCKQASPETSPAVFRQVANHKPPPPWGSHPSVPGRYN